MTRLNSQETYEIFGQMKMGPGISCPVELMGKKAKLKCTEGDVFELPADAVALSYRARTDLLDKGCEGELQYPCLGCKADRSECAKCAAACLG